MSHLFQSPKQPSKPRHILISLTDIESKQTTSSLMEVSGAVRRGWSGVSFRLNLLRTHTSSLASHERGQSYYVFLTIALHCLNFSRNLWLPPLCLLWPSLSGHCGREKHWSTVVLWLLIPRVAQPQITPLQTGSWFIVPKHVWLCTGFLLQLLLTM